MLPEYETLGTHRMMVEDCNLRVFRRPVPLAA
jgi:hypothetical protein